jgi:hypothetical protein
MAASLSDHRANMVLASSALSAVRAATSVCAAAAGGFTPEQCTEGVALANELHDLFTRSIAAASVCDEHVFGSPAASLPHLPTELLLQVVRHLDVRDLGRLACTCRQLYFGPPRPPSVVEEELRRRAAEAGRWLPATPPADLSGWVPALLQREWRDSLEVGTVAAGLRPNSLFIDASGALLVCGLEDELGVLGLPREQGDNEDGDHQFRTVLVPTPVSSMAGVRIRQVAAGYYCSLAVSEAGQVYMWGGPHCGRLASDAEDRLVPTLIEELSHHRVRQVAIAVEICAAVTEEGLLFTWATGAQFHVQAEKRQPLLGLGLHGATIGSSRPPQCVTALKDEGVASGGHWEKFHTGDHGGRGRLLFWRRHVWKPRSRR